MQGDLISRSEFKKKLVDYNRHLIAREEKATAEEDYEELNAICYERRAYFMLLSFLDDMPCAFDVEAVVEELEAREKSYRTASKKKSMEFPQKMYYTGIMRGYEYSREIVQNGGKE